jgi:hypothetical protein
MPTVQPPYVNGNGHAPLPQSKRAFQRSLPVRLGGLEDQVNAHDHSVDEIRSRLMALEARAEAASDAACVELVWGVVDALRLALGKRRSRRRPERGPSNEWKLNA